MKYRWKIKKIKLNPGDDLTIELKDTIIEATYFKAGNKTFSRVTTGPKIVGDHQKDNISD